MKRSTAAPPPPPRAVFLDFDGVVLESADIKTDAFGWLFRGEPSRRAIVEYHRRNAGVSRFVKFAHIHRAILKKPYGSAERRRLGAAFARYVRGRVLAAPFVSGARRFLARPGPRIKLFIVSGTPTAELRDIVRRRGLARRFVAVVGSPPDKATALRRLLRRHRLRPAETLYVGDALNDHRAAVRCGVRFLGRVKPGQRSPFPRSVPRVRDFAGVERFLKRWPSRVSGAA